MAGEGGRMSDTHATATNPDAAQSVLEPDLIAARTFLELLDPDAEDFCFQCFDDGELKRGHLAKVAHGTLDEEAGRLTAWNRAGAGVFVTINETDGMGRKAENITRVRAVFPDLDGAPLQPVLACMLEPHIIIESSPGKYHAYWIVDGLPLDQFRPVQKAIAARFGGDRSVHDLPRVMRLPGFWHQKGEPFRTRIHGISDRLPYTAAQILAEFPCVAPRGARTEGNGHDEQAEEMAELVRQILTSESYHVPLRNLAWRYLAAGMAPGQVVETLRGLLLSAPDERDDRWHARYNDIPRAVSTAEEKLLEQGNVLSVDAPVCLPPDFDTADDVAGDTLYDFSHDGLALDMGRLWSGLWKHVHLWGRWLYWVNTHWKKDEKLAHMTRARAYLRKRADNFVKAAHAGKLGDPEKAVPAAESTAKWLRSKTTIANVVDLARCNPELVAITEQWDADKFLLGMLGPTCDLRTGVFYEPLPDDFITKVTSVRAIAAAWRPADTPLWTTFLKRITDDSEDLQNYLQRMAGYCLTGSIQEHVLFFLYGTGANGKSVFVNTLLGIWKDYGLTIGTDMLMVSQTDRHPTEVARLRGVRLAVGSEVEVGRTWAESKIKALTGGDRLQARFMRQDFFEFDPLFKLMIIGNNKPSLRGVDEAIRRRLHLIPFTVTIPPAERDRALPEKLKAEWPSILGWAIAGCRTWQADGLNPPKAVVDATAEYLSGEDTFERWRDECATPDINAWESSADLWGSWQSWAQRAGEPVGKQRAFSNMLVEHGLIPEPQGHKNTRGFKGLRINRIDYTEDLRRADD
jgi:putative DNA primase/helicase